MPLQLVDKMELIPHVCVACGCAPRDDEGNVKPAVDLGVDVNWGEEAYLCEECCGIISDLFGRVGQDEHDDLQEYCQLVTHERDELRESFDELQERFDRALDGKKAVAEHKRSKVVVASG